jgi:hypothetical protein
MTKLNAIDVMDVFENKLHPQINKLRFLRELALDSGAEFGGFYEEPEYSVCNGLYEILLGVTKTKTYDAGWAEIQQMFESAKKEKEE